MEIVELLVVKYGEAKRAAIVEDVLALLQLEAKLEARMGCAHLVQVCSLKPKLGFVGAQRRGSRRAVAIAGWENWSAA